MRQGMNPNRLEVVSGYAPIVACVITHLPNLEGYHAERINVIRASLETLRANTGLSYPGGFDIMVWDNGSCAMFTDWLHNDYMPDYLILSANVGKSIARASMVGMLPKKTIVCVADDDVFYYPEWLTKQLEVLTVYPNVGTVSGWPVRTQFRFHNKSTQQWGYKYAEGYEIGKFISPEEDKDFCDSIGRGYNYQINYTRNDQDIKLTYRGVETYDTGHHMQFIGGAGIIRNYLEYTPLAMADERPFEKAIDEAGLLRLTTFKRYTQHIGNKLDTKLEGLWRQYVT